MAGRIRALILSSALGAVLLGCPCVALAAYPGGAAPEGVVSTATSATTGGARPSVVPPKRADSGGERKAVAKRPVARKPAAPSPTGDSAGSGGRFPLLGRSWSFAGADGRFGAKRDGHIHEGQDVMAPEGTPIVAPLPGTITWTANQPAGAGIYAVLHCSDRRDYVFMHIRPGTLRVRPGDTLTEGSQFAAVGHTGDATGPHLHFEIWVGGWGQKGGRPIDPLPDLERWAGVRAGSARSASMRPARAPSRD